MTKEKAARPKIGRPLQEQLPPVLGGFVEAVPSHVLWDGTGMLSFNLKNIIPRGMPFSGFQRRRFIPFPVRARRARAMFGTHP